MKYKKLVLIFIFLGVLLVGCSVHAEISEGEMNRLRLGYEDSRISIMSEAEKRNILDNYDLEHAIKDTKSFVGTLSGKNRGYIWREISNEEYDNLEIHPTKAGDIYETGGKQIKLVSINHGGTWDTYLHVNWKVIPVTRSFDVMGLRFQNVAYLDNSEYGFQFYRPAGSSQMQSIGYSSNGTNIKKQYEGFGISMNLVNQNIVELETEIGADAVISCAGPYIFGSYQHAVHNVSLAQSQDYNISSSGFGNVLNFSQRVMNYYDDMQGVHVQLF